MRKYTHSELMTPYGLDYIQLGNSKWSPGVILERYGPRNYKVQMGQKAFKHHEDQLR